MGKSWVRGGDNQSIQKPQTFVKQVKRKTHVWVRDNTAPVQPPRADQEGSSSHFRGREGIAGPSLQINGQCSQIDNVADNPAKKRRLAAQGRFLRPVEQSSTGNGVGLLHQSVQQNSTKALEAKEEQDEKREKLREEAEALRRRIAEGEAKIRAAKVIK